MSTRACSRRRRCEMRMHSKHLRPSVDGVMCRTSSCPESCIRRPPPKVPPPARSPWPTGST
eukprot:4763356-Prymnesium_polylepis.1